MTHFPLSFIVGEIVLPKYTSFNENDLWLSLASIKSVCNVTIKVVDGVHIRSTYRICENPP